MQAWDGTVYHRGTVVEHRVYGRGCVLCTEDGGISEVKFSQHSRFCLVEHLDPIGELPVNGWDQDEPQDGVKCCTKCWGVFPLAQFRRDRCMADGHASWCKTCARAYSRQWNADKRNNVGKVCKGCNRQYDLDQFGTAPGGRRRQYCLECWPPGKARCRGCGLLVEDAGKRHDWTCDPCTKRIAKEKYARKVGRKPGNNTGNKIALSAG